MLVTLLVALLYICLLCVIGYAAIALIEWAVGKPLPPPVQILFRAIVAILCIVILIQALTGWSGGLALPYLHR